jgi:hypothetical protein
MAGQLVFDDRWTIRPRQAVTQPGTPGRKPPLCAACRAREARYGFRGAADDPRVDRSRTLCFECFRLEIGRRQEAAQTIQVRLPLEETLASVGRRRRRAQIAARHALDVAQG